MSTNFPLPDTFLIILNEVLVAKDIELTISDMRPEARMVVARSMSEVDLAEIGGELAAAFVRHDLSNADRLRIAERLQRDGGLLVFVGQEVAPVPAGESVLPYPFSRDDVTNLLSMVRSE
jgi:hypothetical protein